MLREAVAQTRFLARGLVPVGSDPDALRNGLTELAARIDALGRVHCSFDSPQPVEIGKPDVAAHLYRIAQEAVNNAMKHAQAKTVVIRLVQEGAGLLLEVIDDGRGLQKTTRQGLGLGVMRYRANIIGAELSVSSKRTGGVAVSCRLPSMP